MSAAPAPFPLVLSAAQMRAADRAATERLGVPSLVLMENAGRGVAEIVRARLEKRGSDDGFVAIVCGAGANGGDGFVVGRHLIQRGVPVRVLLCADAKRLTGDAALNFTALERLGVAIEDGSAWTDVGAWRARLAGASAIVDAIFGIGLRDAITGVPAAALEAMNEARALKVAVDIPSGLDADSGQARGPVFRADVTATMGARKLGLVIDASAPVGSVEVVDLGVPVLPAADAGPLAHWIDGAAVYAALPRRGATAHKGTAGHLLVVAGSAGKTGSALLAGRAALRAGAGLVTLASTEVGQAALDAKVVEIMTGSYSAGEDADPSSSGAALGALASGKGAVVIGPGIPTGPNMRALVRDFAARLAAPMVIDADALNLLGSDIVRVLSNVPAPRVLTPHPGEMSRLTGRAIQEVQANRLATARDLAARTHAVVVLKGARTLVAAPDGTVFINPTAEGALGTAGAGDVLSGLLGAFLVQGLDALSASRAAVFIHGAAGELVAQRLGSGLIAGDLPDAIAAVIHSAHGAHSAPGAHAAH